MSRIGINYRDVATAAAKVQGHNANPTVDRIREVLGTGSKSTIARHLKEWKNSNGDVANANGLPLELIALVTGLWERLQGLAEQQILEHQKEDVEKIQVIDAKFIQAQKKNAELQSQYHQMEETAFKANEANKVLEQHLAEERLLNSKQQGQITSLEEHLATQKQENLKIHSLLKNMQNNLEHYQDSMQKLQQEQLLSLDKQKSCFEQEISALRSQLSDAIKMGSDLKFQNEQLKQHLSEFELIKRHNQALELGCRDKEIRLIGLEEKCEQITGEHEKITQELGLKNKIIVATDQTIAVANSRLNDLEQALQQANDKISTLRHEQLFIVQEKANLEGQLKQLVRA